MNSRHIASAAFVGIAIAAQLLSLAGLWRMRTVYDRLHYMAPSSVVGSASIAIAIVISELFTQRGVKALLVVVVFIVLGPVLTHATARAARIREFGDWRLTETKKGRA